MRVNRPATRWVLPLALASALALTACSNDSNKNSGSSGLGGSGSRQTNKIAIQGHLSGATKAIGATYGDAGLAFISPSATNPTLSQQGFPTFHRIVPSDNVEGSQ